MINYFLLLDENQTTDQKVVSSNPAGCAIKKAPLLGLFLYLKNTFFSAGFEPRFDLARKLTLRAP